jgi:hypothetical protein
LKHWSHRTGQVPEAQIFDSHPSYHEQHSLHYSKQVKSQNSFKYQTQYSKSEIF